jgi:hypothetical protein
VLALAVSIGRGGVRRRARVPAMKQILLTGAVAGLAGLIVDVVDELWIAHATEPGAPAQRILDDPSIPAAAVAAAAVLLALTYGLRGWGVGLIAGPIAALVTAAGSLGALGLVGSAIPDAATAGGVVTDALGYGFAITLLAAAVVPTGGSLMHTTRSTFSIMTCAALLAAAAALAVAAVRYAGHSARRKGPASCPVLGGPNDR